MEAFLKSLLAKVGGAVVTGAAASLAKVDYTALGAYQGLAQAGALLAAELASALDAKWNPPPPSTANTAANTNAG